MSQIIDCSNLFVEQNSQYGIGTAEEISKDVHSFTEIESTNLNIALGWLANEFRVTISPTPKMDRNGVPYYWIGRGTDKASTGIKIPVKPWVKRLLESILEGQKVNVSLEELVTVADSLIEQKSENRSGVQDSENSVLHNTDSDSKN